MEGTNTQADTLAESLIHLENVLQSVKYHLPWFYDPISTTPIKKAVQKLIDSLPAAVVATAVPSEDQRRIDGIVEKYLKMEGDGGIAEVKRQPMKYTAIQSCVQPKILKTGQVIVKPAKGTSYVDSSQDNVNGHITQMQIANSEKALQKSLRLIEAIRKAMVGSSCTVKTPGTTEEVSLMVKQLRENCTSLAKWISQLNNRRQVARILTKLRHRGTVRTLLGRIEDEKGKKEIWRF
ncbi:unnamed protein product [Mesocestoides corti]|uniref:Uncharacterized protein n=1 Tax=Mesocestoides corti TaxID=53468 RepID=A0A0R3ULR4_MESCO|nr:unnamed protein product [Mesocestoides corti]